MDRFRAMSSGFRISAAPLRGVPGRAVLCGAVLAFPASLVLFWPGVAMYDSVAQFEQALSGDYQDWHPPVLARLWAGLHVLFGGGAAPMLVLQMALYWSGLALTALALAHIGKRRAAAFVIGIGLFPPFLGWQAVVLKDTQMLGALLGAIGIVAWWRLRGAKLPRAALAGAIVLAGYATLVRTNAVFATVPLMVMLFAPARWWVRNVLTLAGIGAVVAVAPAINHGVFGAAPSGIERTEPLYDLAGIAVRSPATPVGLSPAAVHAIAARHCVKPLFWDPLGTPARCGTLLDPLRALPVPTLYGMLASAVVRAPLAYGAHRLAHLDSTERWLVAGGWPGAAPPASSEPNTLGLGSPGRAAGVWQAFARWTAETPLGWPVAWVVVALTGLAVAAARPPGPVRDLAAALLVSALMLESSFAVLSIASDLRYHLWPMVATALASVLLRADAPWPRRALIAGGAALALVIGTGVAARLLLPPAPAGYAAQLV